MSLPGSASERIDYIQKLFLRVASCVELIDEMDEVIDQLEEEPAAFRSIAYESASMVIGVKDLSNKIGLHGWKQFRQACSGRHSFHVDIGLGWAFAKTGLHPNEFLNSSNLVMNRMVYDGIGYYYGMFRGRSILKNKTIPEGIEDINGFDQGLGRRLWYLAKARVDDLLLLISDFNDARRADLWRGAGIACGYVGGNNSAELDQLSNAAGGHKKQLELGVTLAALSRIASNSVNEEVNTALQLVCNTTIEELREGSKAAGEFYYL